MKQSNQTLLTMIALIVALGGLLMGFDASVISGVNSFIQEEFSLTELELGFSVSSLTLVAAIAMFVAGPLSERYGRRGVLRWAAILYAISAVGSALAPSYTALVIARMIGGLGVGASLILAPMYIAEIAPSEIRGRMVSFNQLNIVIGISLAFFTNYLLLEWSDSGKAWVSALGIDKYTWRWMLGLEAVPAIAYFFGLFLVPRSPRWLLMQGKNKEAALILSRFTDSNQAQEEIKTIQQAIEEDSNKSKVGFGDLFHPSLKLVLTIGIVVAVLQQITGINSVFFYAPMIFEQSGIGTNASFVQAIFVGLVNLVFTVLAILFIDKLGRKPLLSGGVAGIAVSMIALAFSFFNATYTLEEKSFAKAVGYTVPQEVIAQYGSSFENEGEMAAFLEPLMGEDWETHGGEVVKQSIVINSTVVLIAILAFVASFAISIGPVMWVLFSELFPNKIRAVAISFVGLINSAVSFLVQLVFPWELKYLGSGTTFLIYGLLAVAGLLFVVRVVPETKGKSLEEIEDALVKGKA
ncbi:MAG: hypothetical protein SchgKO_09750 [Schleiferiaceae bacterium]